MKDFLAYFLAYVRANNPWWYPADYTPAICEATATARKHEGPHECEENAGHGYKHICACGIRWAA